MSTPVTVIGGGLCGSLAAIVLARRGFEVTVIEKRSDLRNHDLPAGRSINLALANRGLKPLKDVGLEDRVRDLLTVMRGRMIHDTQGKLDLQPYGQLPWEVIYSVSRPGLNALLTTAAEHDHGVRFHFDTACARVDLAGDRAEFHNMQTGETFSRPLGPTIATDGAGSVIRNALVAQAGVDCRVDMLDHRYKELSIPPSDDGDYRMDPNALHIWPRGGYMLIALPNLDRSFTVTLFMQASGEPGFAELATTSDVRDFFAREFPDVVPLMPGLEQDWSANPLGELGTVRCAPWHIGGQVLLLGDAAHAIVPFHGQGMNCAFEDCGELAASLEATGDDWQQAFPRIAARRKPSADAIADMALENYVEMRDSVRDPGFLLRQEVAFELERRHPDRFVRRYSLVMFRDDVSYAEAQRRGQVQEGILRELTAGKTTAADVDVAAAAAAIEQRLDPIPHPR